MSAQCVTIYRSNEMTTARAREIVVRGIMEAAEYFMGGNEVADILLAWRATLDVKGFVDRFYTDCSHEAAYRAERMGLLTPNSLRASDIEGVGAVAIIIPSNRLLSDICRAWEGTFLPGTMNTDRRACATRYMELNMPAPAGRYFREVVSIIAEEFVQEATESDLNVAFYANDSFADALAPADSPTPTDYLKPVYFVSPLHTPRKIAERVRERIGKPSSEIWPDVCFSPSLD